MEPENDLITVTISFGIYWVRIHNACLTWYHCAPIRVCAPRIVTELRSLHSQQMHSKTVCWLKCQKVRTNGPQNVPIPTLQPAHQRGHRKTLNHSVDSSQQLLYRAATFGQLAY